MGWSQIWAIARRDLNGRFRGLRLLVLCLFLGVATLATIGSLTSAITTELSARGQVILGGDIEFAMSQRLASEDEKAAFRNEGELSETVRMQAMANRVGETGDDGPQAILAQLKGVDNVYPLYGDLLLEGGKAASPLASDAIYVGAGLSDRLRLSVGDTVRFGEAEFRIAGLIAEEPDRLGEGFTLGPVALASMQGIERTGLVRPGSLYESKYRIRTPGTANIENVIERLNTAFPESGWEVKDRERGAPGATRFILRMGQFLTLVGLTALVVAGIGVGNGVASYLAGKRGSIATLKILGAQSGDILRIYMLQILAVSAVAIAAGLLAGMFLPQLIVYLAGDVLPVRPGFAVYPFPLFVSALYGLLIALIFALPPLARARLVPPAGLFRSVVDGAVQRDWRTYAIVAGGAMLIAAIAIFTARDPVFSAGFLFSVLAVLGLLALIGWAIGKIAARLPRPRQPLARLALTNLHRPGSQTGQLVVALGLGLTLFVTLAAIQTSLNNEIERTIPKQAPNLFVLDVPVEEREIFLQKITAEAPEAEVNTVPALRGTITEYAGQRVAELEDIPDNAWVLRGERGLTYSETLPEGSELVEGEWWAEGYEGAPLVSVDVEMANALGLKLGDPLTVSLLGREFTAEVASFRQINWDTMGFNYVMVFSPNTLRDAPHNLAATVTMDDASERAVSRALLDRFPSISVIEVRDVIGQVQIILQQMASAIAAAASIAILSGIAVLIGAIAASRQSRIYDSVIMKTLGATRRQILSAQALEYGLLAVLLASVALALGLFTGWYVIVQIFEFNWAPDWGVVLAMLGGGALLTLILGTVGSLPVLAARPAQALRSL